MCIGDYTDFYAGLNHAYNVGVLFRGAQDALQPNYRHLPLGYPGRASTVRVSGHPVRRPWGQSQPPPGSKTPAFGLCQKLDVELELAAFVCKGNGTEYRPVPVGHAAEYIFGYVLMNDWSARDIQAWEYVPLGPFHSKNVCTTISPWVVLADALEPFRCASTIPPPSTKVLPYLSEPNSIEGTGNQIRQGSYYVNLTMSLRPNALSTDQTSSTPRPIPISQTNSSNPLFSFPQMLAHHTITGCEMHVGDLLGSGTISGPDRESMGSLLEMTCNGKEGLVLEDTDGSSARTITRRSLEDGDEVVITGVSRSRGRLLGFGECRGVIMPGIDSISSNP